MQSVYIETFLVCVIWRAPLKVKEETSLHMIGWLCDYVRNYLEISYALQIRICPSIMHIEYVKTFVQKSLWLTWAKLLSLATQVDNEFLLPRGRQPFQPFAYQIRVSPGDVRQQKNMNQRHWNIRLYVITHSSYMIQSSKYLFYLVDVWKNNPNYIF